MKKMRKTKMRSKKNARKTKRIRGGSLYPTQDSTFDPAKINDPVLQGKASSAILSARKNREEEVGIQKFFSRASYRPSYINGKLGLTQEQADFNEAKKFYLKHRNSGQ